MNETLLYQLIGQKIRIAREKMRPAKISQEKLADKLGLTRASIVNIEAGRQKTPIHTLWMIADELHIEMLDLLPSRIDFAAAGEPVKISPQTLAQIEQAFSDPLIKERMLRFVSRKTTNEQ